MEQKLLIANEGCTENETKCEANGRAGKRQKIK